MVENHVEIAMRKQIWDATVPIMINVASDDIATIEKPRPLFLNVPRIAYLCNEPLELVREHFLPYVLDVSTQNWFEVVDEPVKWNYPVGVLYDSQCQELVWNLTIHFSNFPTSRLMKLRGKEFRSFFIYSIKESTYAKHRDISAINSFGMKELNDLFYGATENDFNRFWGVNNLIHTKIRHMPIRVLQPRNPIRQIVVDCMEAEGVEKLVTLGDFLFREFPNWFEDIESLKCQFLIHGITPPLETPLIWLACNLVYPDGFLYLVIRPCKTAVKI